MLACYGENNRPIAGNNKKIKKAKAMKKQNQGYLTTVTKMELEKLTAITEEKLAADCKLEERKEHFTVAELWNIQRQRRSFMQRRFIM